jgi:large subunit ribosomal protein L25
MAIQEMIEAQPRDGVRTKNVARRLRRNGQIPAVVYGAKKDSIPVTVDPRQISRILHSESGHNTIFDLQVGSERTKAMIVDWQYEPIKGTLLHIDLKRVAMDQTLRVKVPIQTQGEAAGVKQQGGILELVLRELEVECLPGDIPSHFDVDVSNLVFGQVLRVADIPRSGKVKFVTDENQPVAHITSVKEAPEATAEATAEVAATPAEPEVIKKGKQEVAPEEGTETKGAEAKEGKK